MLPAPIYSSQGIPQDHSYPFQHTDGGFQTVFIQWPQRGHSNTPEEVDRDEKGEVSEQYEDDEESDDEEVDEDLESDSGILQWARDPRTLRTLEELRGDFKSELKDPSLWTLQRIADITQGERLYAAKEVVRLWLLLVAGLTKTPKGAELQLPQARLPEGLPPHKVLSWEDADELVGEAREACFGRDVEERYKRDARLAILFLFPEAATKGLSEGDKKRIFTIALKVWMLHPSRAEGLLWVMDKEYPDTRTEVGQVREWANSMSEDFMTYTALYPPPIIVTPRH